MSVLRDCVLLCLGSEPMKVEWLHPGGQQSGAPGGGGGVEGEDFLTDVQQTATGDCVRASMTIPDCVESEDRGEWTCRVSNKYGVATTLTTLHVQPQTQPQGNYTYYYYIFTPHYPHPTQGKITV